MKIEDIDKAVELKAELDKLQKFVADLKRMLLKQVNSLSIKSNETIGGAFSFEICSDDFSEIINNTTNQIKQKYELRIEDINREIKEL